ncbi:hypothetical protein AURDEDRAFT_161117 [Auricularia subglabra TFB-10046 SS5]|nr:hypothetical protein AURDEDRAFT_161117 [Auricularia subglabra TFB-10046 SS5]
MSSAEEDYNDHDDHSPDNQEDARAKKRRVQRACDICRRKKIRCDGGQMPNNRCSNCIAYNYDCTYIEAAKKRGPPKGYVESLETRLEKMEKLLQRVSNWSEPPLCPDADFTQELGAQIDKEAWMASGGDKSSGSGAAGAKKVAAAPKKSTPPIRPHSQMCQQHNSQYTPTSASVEDSLVPSDDERMLVRLTERPKQPIVIDKRFHGKSSGLMLIQAAVDFKREHSGIDVFRDNYPNHRRAEFWQTNPWEFRNERVDEQELHFNFPDPGLMEQLIEQYFVKVNLYHPLLHRGLFDEQMRARLHYEDSHFAAIVLLVCAIGSRFVDDERVLLDPGKMHSAGWCYFEQVEPFRRFKITPPRLFDLQIQVLSIMFIAGTSSPHAGWTILGIGIRMAQDVGAHRNKVYKDKPNLDDELWKRAFWILVSLDRTTSASFGRPCAIQDEDFDLDLPLEVDDDCWDLSDPSHPLLHPQPAGRPSVISYFVCHMKLSQILAFALRTIYSINKSKILLGFVGPQWEQHIVAELDSALNKWIDSVPDHLRWDPNREELQWFDQSALLYCTYYHLQILIHRPFIPSPKKPSPLSFPSLAICTNAARSCSHVLDIQMRRSDVVMPWQCVSAFTSGIVLLLNIWGVKKSATSPDAAQQMQDVHKCMNVLTHVENRWYSAGRLWDILCELASVRDFPLPAATAEGGSSNKRARPSDRDGEAQTTSPATSSQRQNLSVQRPIARARSVIPGQARPEMQPSPSSSLSPATSHSSAGPSFIGPDPIFPNGLPVATSELAQAPLHPIYNQYFGHSGFSPDSVNWLQQDLGTNMSVDPLMSGAFDVNAFPPLNMGGTDPLDLSNLAALQQPQQQQQQQTMPPLPFNTNQMDPAMFGNGMAPKLGTTVGDLQLESMNMWSQAPSGWEWEDWSNYLSGQPAPQTTAHSQQSSHSQQQSQS